LFSEKILKSKVPNCPQTSLTTVLSADTLQEKEALKNQSHRKIHGKHTLPVSRDWRS